MTGHLLIILIMGNILLNLSLFRALTGSV